MSSGAKTLLATNALTLVVALVFLPPGASAICPNTVEQDEQTLWNVHNCSPAFRDWFRPYFNLQSSHWDGWGWTSCDPTQTFPKMWDSAYLLTYGLQDGGLGPWHSDVDYYRWAAGSQHDFRYEPEDASDVFATAYTGWLFTNRVEMKCPSFNGRTAGVRAGTMLHEATHIIYGSPLGVWQHQSNPPGSNCGSENCSDDWYFHSFNSYPYGSLTNRLHSMVQIQIEYDCDLAEFGEGWVPYTTRLLAQSEANNRMANRIRNQPGWTCGQPRPLPAVGANPFTYATGRDQYLACWGIAGRISSNCNDISDLNDRQMCHAMSTSTQSSCTSMTDRNLQLACYGMSVAPNYPSNCNDITDAAMRDFCSSVSSWGNSGTCSGVTSPSDKALCQALTYRNSSYCASITNNNNKWFCYGAASRTNSYCANIVQ